MMKKLSRSYFPLLLLLTCVLVHCWQHAITGLNLSYLPHQEIVSLAIMTPILLGLTYLTTFVMLKQSGGKKPVVCSIVSTAVMFVLFLSIGVHFLNHAAYRYAGYLPIPLLPELPGGYFILSVTVLCLLHLTGLMICRFIKEKQKALPVILSLVGWIILNGCLIFMTI